MTVSAIRSSCAVLALAALPAVATAQSFDYSGYVQADTLTDGTSGSETLIVGTLNFSTDSLFGSFGAEGSVLAIGTLSSNFVAGGTVALTYTGNFGKLSFGLPASAAKGASHLPTIGGVAYFDEYVADMVKGDLVSYIATSSMGTLFGVRYDGNISGMDVSASVHGQNSFSNLVGAVAVSYETGNTFVVGTVEGGTGGGFVLYHVEAGIDNGTTSFGIGATGVTNAPVNPLYMAFASYDPTDALSFSAIVTNDSANTAYSVAARYDFASGLYGTVGAIGGVGPDTLYNVGVGFAF